MMNMDIDIYRHFENYISNILDKMMNAHQNLLMKNAKYQGKSNPTNFQILLMSHF